MFVRNAITFTFLLNCFGFVPVFSQTREIDSIRHEINKLAHVSNKKKVDLYNRQAHFFEFVSQDSMRVYLSKGRNLAIRLKYYAGLGKSHIYAGHLASDIDELDSSLWHYTQAGYYFEKIKDKINLGEAVKLQAESYRYKGVYKSALKSYQRAMDIFEDAGSKDGVAGTYYSMGAMYQEMERDDKALECYENALRINRQINKPIEMANYITAVGIMKDRKKDYTTAKKHFAEAKAIYEKHNYDNGLSNLYTWMAITAYNEKDFQLSLKYFFESLALYEKINSVTGRMYAYNNIGSIYMELNDFANALKWQKEGLEMAKKNKIKANIRYAYETLTVTYERMGDYKNAFSAGAMTMKYKDSLLNETTAKQLSELDKKYESAKKDKKLLEKDAEILRQSALAQQQATQRNYFIGGFAAMIIISIIIFRSYNQNKKARRIIATQKQEVERQKEMVEAKNKEVLDSIMYAKRLQDAILPPSKLVNHFFPESYILYLPKDIVAGDFYFMEQSGDKIVLAVADCTGHGVPGAMVSIVCSNALNRTVKEFKITGAGEILHKVRELVLETFAKSESEVKDGMDISLCVFDSSKKTCEWAGANNPLWILRNGEILEFKPNKQPIGLDAALKPFTAHSIQLQKKDTLYLFTDGYQDQFGGSDVRVGGKKLKASNMKKLIVSCGNRPLSEQHLFMTEAFEKWKGDLEQVDDVCMIGIRI